MTKRQVPLTPTATGYTFSLPKPAPEVLYVDKAPDGSLLSAVPIPGVEPIILGEGDAAVYAWPIKAP